VAIHSALLAVELVAPMHAVNGGKGVEVELRPFLTTAVQRGDWSVSHLGCFTPAERAVGRLQLKCDGTR